MKKSADRLEAEKAFVALEYFIWNLDGYCACQKHPCQRHVDGCIYIEILKKMKDIRKEARIDTRRSIMKGLLEASNRRMMESWDAVPDRNQ